MFDHILAGRWWDVGLQLVEGCTKVSPGCNNCWSLTAANMRRFNPNPKVADRYEDTVYKDPLCRPQWTGQVNPQWQDLDKIGRARKPQVYTFWNDLFHPGVEEAFITSVMLKILTRHQHFYIICTKRPERALKYFQRCYPDYVRLQGSNPFLNRLMLMTTAENQEMADLRIPILLQIPGVLHGVSVEPGLGPIILEDYHPVLGPPHIGRDYLRETIDPFTEKIVKAKLDWVICGGESGPHARPMHPDIPLKLRDDCVAAGVPFFFKAWGEWAPFDHPYPVCQDTRYKMKKNETGFRGWGGI